MIAEECAFSPRDLTGVRADARKGLLALTDGTPSVALIRADISWPIRHYTLRGPWGCGGGPFSVWWGWCSAVSYSPTPWRVQYHRRWRA
jgi:hypothetical protein